jgi:negative regulator of flagellin synthesis FlgM
VPAAAVKADGTARTQSTGETVELTSSAKLLERLEKTLASLPEIDRARVEAVKTAIENGDYQIDADRIADALLRADR